jgi:hypothetical protein
MPISAPRLSTCGVSRIESAHRWHADRVSSRFIAADLLLGSRYATSVRSADRLTVSGIVEFSVSGVEFDGQCDWAADAEDGFPGCGAGGADIGHAAGRDCECLGEFCFGEVDAEA